MPVIMKYLLKPIRSTRIPSGALQHVTMIYVIMIALPADTCVKQNLTCINLLALSKKHT
jgi:hypothetical protein